MRYPRPYIQSRYKHTDEQLDKLYDFVKFGMKDGMLSIAKAKKISFLTVDKDGTLDNYDEYDIFIAPEPAAGRLKQFNTFALNRRTGQILVLGRELSRKHALAIAVGRI